MVSYFILSVSFPFNEQKVTTKVKFGWIFAGHTTLSFAFLKRTKSFAFLKHLLPHYINHSKTLISDPTQRYLNIYDFTCIWNYWSFEQNMIYLIKLGANLWSMLRNIPFLQINWTINEPYFNLTKTISGKTIVLDARYNKTA